jgi:tetratricopeptide (TPR) repeat protein
MARRTEGNPQARRVALALLTLLTLLLILPILPELGHGVAHAQRVTVSGQREIYAGLPFVLSVVAEDFDEEPQPVVAGFDVPGGKVTFIDVSPNVSTSISIINGRRSESRRVQYVYRYRVVVDKPGGYRIPAITVTQASKKASSQPANFRATDIEATPNMHVELELPDRPVSVGETFDAAINWYLRAEVTDVDFVVPFFDEPLWMDVHQPEISAYQQRGSTLPFTAGDRELKIPYTSTKVTLDGQEYKRVRFEVAVTAIKAGTLAVEPARVMASLKVGEGRDAFGFRTARTRLFKAEDTPKSLQIQPLPAKGKPQSFSNAVGTAYSIQVRASRTVVKLGEPVALDIVVRGDGRLEGLSLPDLNNPEGLPPEKFTVLDTPNSGEIIDADADVKGSGKAKRFVATVRVKSPEVREIPPIAFSYYNPKAGRYDTVHSQPIALSVEGASIVGAGDVVSAVKTPGQETSEAEAPGSVGSLMGADLSLSPRSATLSRPWTLAAIKPFLFALYLVPLLVLGFRLWQVSTRDRRDRSSEARAALRAVHRELERARTAPARDAAPALLAALRALARATGRDKIRGDAVIARIENESYNPRAAAEPLAGDTLDEAGKLAAELMDEWQRRIRSAGTSRSPGRSSSSGPIAAVLMPWLMLGGALAGGPWTMAHAAGGGEPAVADAAAGAEARVDAARAAYQQALGESDRSARSNGFARAERMFRELVQATPDRPELLTDWGNAALGAQDLGRATLAYRRALALDPGHSRAARNLSWVRNRAPDWLPVPGQKKSLLSRLDVRPGPAFHLIAALAFFAAVLLIVPWGRRQKLLRWLSVLPALVWLIMLVALLVSLRASPPVRDAVVIADGVPMLSADSPGAPPALANPLPAGAEVTIIETRAPWTRIALADGTKGWVQTSAVGQVLPAEL